MNNEKRNLIIDCILMALYIFGAAFNSIFTLIAVIITLLVLSKADIVRSIELQFLLVPFCGIMYLSIGSFSMYNIILLVAFFCILQQKKFLVNTKIAYLMFILAGISMYTVIFNGFNLLKDVVVFDLGILILAFGIESLDAFDAGVLVRKYSVGLLISSIAYLFVDYLPGIKMYITNAQYRLENSTEKVERFSGLLGNPNHYTMALSLAIAGLIVLIVCRKNKKIDYVLLIALIVFGIKSISNSFFIGLLVTALYVSIYLLFKSPSKLLMTVVVSFIIISIYLSVSNSQYLEIILNRLSFSNDQFDLNTFTSNRVDHYRIYIDTIVNNLRILFLGNGYGTLINGYASHNLILESIYFYGLVGCCLLFGCIVRIYKTSVISGIGFLRYLVLFVLLFRSFAININTSMMFPYYLFISIVFLKGDYRLMGKMGEIESYE